MGRDIGTNVYSNNFEPQVMGLLDARGRAATKADLTTAAQWTSTDGNIYAPKAILVAVTDDPIAANNGLYMLKGDDYSVAINWMKIGSDGNAEFIMVELSSINTIPGTYTPDRYLMGEFIKIQDALSIDTPFFVYQFDGEFGQFPTSAIMDGNNFVLSILYHDEVWLINFDGDKYTITKGGSTPLTNVKVLTTSNLVSPSRGGSIYLSSSDVTIWKNIEVGRDIIVYSGSIGDTRQYVSLSISSIGTGSAQVGKVTYMLNGSMYSFDISYVNPSTYSASKPTKVEGGGGGSNNTYTTTLPILKILDGEDDCFSGSNYTETLNVIEALSSGKQVAYNDYTKNLTIPTGGNAGIGNNGILNAYYELDFAGDVNSNILVFTGLNSKGQLVKATSVESSGSTILEVIGESTTSSESHDLSLDVKTSYRYGVPKIYFRIREIVPNGRIHFVRKKKLRYFPNSLNEDIRRLGYAVMYLDAHNDGGMDVSILSPNIWYEYKITDLDLISSYPPGSSVNGVKRTHGVIRFKGSTYAKSFEFKNAPFTQTETTLHAGLQYNVLSGTNKPLLKERGEVVPIDVKLRILSTSNYSAGYEYNFVVK